MMTKENLGIPSIGTYYQRLHRNQNPHLEQQKTDNFIKEILSTYKTLFPNQTTFEFINYGDTEQVYVLDDGITKKTLLIGQPRLEKGIVKEEYYNLKKLGERYPNLVIKPSHYFSNEYREAYLTNYIYQARCIASQTSGYGVYIPEPYYHFENFTEEDSYQICKVIIANLIRLYDVEKNLGLAECKIGGGDFILEKEYDNEPHTEINTLKRMHLIAARKLINIELKEYIKLIQKEFRLVTYYRDIQEKNQSIIINDKNRISMTRESIEDGIKLGLKLQESTGHIDLTI